MKYHCRTLVIGAARLRKRPSPFVNYRRSSFSAFRPPHEKSSELRDKQESVIMCIVRAAVATGVCSHAGEASIVLRRISEVVTDDEGVICGDTNTSPQPFGPPPLNLRLISALALGGLSALILAVGGYVRVKSLRPDEAAMRGGEDIGGRWKREILKTNRDFILLVNSTINPEVPKNRCGGWNSSPEGRAPSVGSL